MDERSEMLNFGNYVEMRGDGLGDVQFIGRNIQIYLFGWRRIDGVWRRVTTGFAEVPETAIPAENLARLRTEYPNLERPAVSH